MVMNIKRIIREEMEGWEQFEETSAVIDRLHEWMTKHGKKDLTKTIIDFNRPILFGDVSSFIHIFEEMGVNTDIPTFFKNMGGEDIVDIVNLWVDGGGNVTYTDITIDEYTNEEESDLSYIDEDTILDDFDLTEYKILNANEIFGI